MLSSLQANQNRDKKKTPKPYSYLDFSFYKPPADDDGPSGHYGSAYKELIRLKLMPSWALFCYKEIASSAAPDYVPGEPALISSDAILLHPEFKDGGYHGLLIALESAGDQVRTFVSTKGVEVDLRVPYIETKVVAMEDGFLTP